MKKDYSVALLVLTLFAIVGWLAVAAGAFIAFRGSGMRDGVLFVGAGVGIVLAGLILVAAGQLMGAMIDTAQTNALMLDAQAKQLAELKGISANLAAGRPTPGLPVSSEGTTPATSLPPRTERYRGYDLYQRPDGGVFASGRVHENPEAARAFIDRLMKDNP